MKTLLDVGNCSADHGAIRAIAESEFGASVLRAHSASDCFDALEKNDVALVTVNRKLDRDHSDGLQIIRQLKEDDRYSEVPVMMITNYSDHQQAAVDVGAEPGFGKASLNSRETKQILGAFLSEAD